MDQQGGMTRRGFVRGAAFTAGALSLPASAWAHVPGANDDIRVGVVGFKSRGQSHIDAFSGMKGVRVVALCDVDAAILEAGARRLRDKGSPVETFTDVRKLLERKDVDVISTATPNHWHSLITVWACQAGKDVYVEKPVSHNIWEGRQAVRAARKYNRIVQAGTQSRSSAEWREAWAWLREGHIGRIEVSRALCYKRRASIGKVDGPQPIPAGIDYDLWCGPAEKLPLTRKSLHYDWHWVWNSGNGDLGNQGIHQMDIARWALGEGRLAGSVTSIGGRVGYEDDGETANTQFVVLEFGRAKLIFEVRGLPERTGAKAMDRYRGQDIGNIIECQGGYVAGNKAFDRDGKQMAEFTGKGFRGGDHFANFIEGVRSRKVSDLNADILEGHLSSALCHMGNISYRLGAEADPDAVEQSVKDAPQAAETLARMEEHLARNGVDTKTSRLRVGPVLEFDPRGERFLDSDAANAMVSREYRPGFEVPEKV
ncbi:MAG: Gfo/Idh/MocA family oxidoreductase [Armatimonadetes bacterium]|nr:Gfo/Idh/MocA family oxidoreductase [Armatimonadota bacterium]